MDHSHLLINTHNRVEILINTTDIEVKFLTHLHIHLPDKTDPNNIGKYDLVRKYTHSNTTVHR
jgi:hypothetical protein